ncbi:hypothetical protein UFOVP26_2 [uncultured Caudovirales phage]|uniref:Uncharacterized protein n=1 Tax=uncultured Caudovirales phage TaxID=2100421 RepID=A0A6J7WNW7_9CAUD|nr:hypothetical protein UFOVP26_2 [uncultured Caudovirales phage]CAB4123939.1 hypothetical protein UFOVP44_95 [uncultured Caudovirales phage]CAB5219470.1 hypothetical protein UFOVP220_86 [uncultured Caudovirales phage]
MTPFRPGCFGSFVIFNSVPKLCNACVWKSECKTAAKINGEKVKLEILSLEKSEAPKQAQTSSYKLISDAISFDGLPVKVRPIAMKLSKELDDIRRILRIKAKTKCSPHFMRIAFNELEAGFTKKDLKVIYMEQLDWSDGTAASHVSIATKVIEALKIGRLDNGGVMRATL